MLLIGSSRVGPRHDKEPTPDHRNEPIHYLDRRGTVLESRLAQSKVVAEEGSAEEAGEASEGSAKQVGEGSVRDNWMSSPEKKGEGAKPEVQLTLVPPTTNAPLLSAPRLGVDPSMSPNPSP
ncbi:uncharacterized protein A4U43_C08F20380 [Asparagus officinalis]|nr:uncharacterized protein A4U43_C08F20380 [Asparagus officinalis]